MKHWHWDRRNQRPITLAHPRGNRKHWHAWEGYVGYGRTRGTLTVPSIWVKGKGFSRSRLVKV